MQQARPYLVLILLVLAFGYKLAFTDLILARGDTYAYFYPYWDARDAALAVGEIPLWSPDLFMGVPLLANPQLGALYPPNWLTVGLPAPDAVRVSILLHIGVALLGGYLLARHYIAGIPAIVAGAVFALGGYIGAHVEQINQLQGLAWMPWLFLLFERALVEETRRRWLIVLALGAVWALQLLSGHTQTVFITGIGLVVYGAARIAITRGVRPLRGVLVLVLAVIIAVLLASPQLLPTQELIALSNRGDGLTQQEATAFSLNPFLVGRGLLPSYDAQPFGEYIGYIGVIGLGLAVIGAFSADRRRWPWLILALVGLLLAFGRHNPLYWPLATLPGFNLFRVPARWLALFALGMAMLAGFGTQSLLNAQASRRWRVVLVVVGLVGGLMLLSLLSDWAAAEVDGSALPTLRTWLLWVGALGVFAVLYLSRRLKYALPLLLVAELWLAAQFLPYNDLTDPAVYNAPRFAINQMRVYTQDETPPGRLLSISGLLFDPGDQAALESRWAAMPISERAARYAFTATKMQETLSANLPLTWGVPSVDGFGGGVLPTAYYTAFTSLLLPEGTLRTVDGRLREVLAQPDCRGACVPADRWLDLMNVRYLLLDKVYDLNHEGIFYDTGLVFPEDTITLDNLPDFVFDGVHVLCDDCDPPRVSVDDAPLTLIDDDVTLDGLTLARYEADFALTGTVQINAETEIRAVTLVDNRTGDFLQLAPPGWQRIYSADVKIYENLDVLPRAFVVHEAIALPDTWDGTEAALDAMQAPDFDPAQTVVINTDATLDHLSGANGDSTVDIMEYTPTRIVIEVEAAAAGYLVLTDAYYPRWRATNGLLEERPIYRADVMFRAIPVEAGQQTLILTYF